jgi:hypothetical protein
VVWLLVPQAQPSVALSNLLPCHQNGGVLFGHYPAPKAPSDEGQTQTRNRLTIQVARNHQATNQKHPASQTTLCSTSGFCCWEASWLRVGCCNQL